AQSSAGVQSPEVPAAHVPLGVRVPDRQAGASEPWTALPGVPRESRGAKQQPRRRRAVDPGGQRPIARLRLGALLSPFPSPFARDRKSTRLNTSHVSISYAVFCLKKKKQH